MIAVRLRFAEALGKKRSTMSGLTGGWSALTAGGHDPGSDRGVRLLRRDLTPRCIGSIFLPG